MRIRGCGRGLFRMFCGENLFSINILAYRINLTKAFSTTPSSSETMLKSREIVHTESDLSTAGESTTTYTCRVCGQPGHRSFQCKDRTSVRKQAVVKSSTVASNSHRIFIPQLPDSITSERLKRHFEQFGTVTSVLYPASNAVQVDSC